jgi:type II secretory pathway pseudopilin PulG
MIEMSAVMVIMACLLSVIIPGGFKRVREAQSRKALADMRTIAQATIDFYMSQGVCPTATSQLVPVYMPQPVNLSPGYQFNCTPNMVSILDPEGHVLVTQRVPYVFIGRVLYDTAHISGS